MVQSQCVRHLQWAFWRIKWKEAGGRALMQVLPCLTAPYCFVNQSIDQPLYLLIHQASIYQSMNQSIMMFVMLSADLHVITFVIA